MTRSCGDAARLLGFMALLMPVLRTGPLVRLYPCVPYDAGYLRIGPRDRDVARCPDVRHVLRVELMEWSQVRVTCVCEGKP